MFKNWSGKDGARYPQAHNAPRSITSDHSGALRPPESPPCEGKDIKFWVCDIWHGGTIALSFEFTTEGCAKPVVGEAEAIPVPIHTKLVTMDEGQQQLPGRHSLLLSMGTSWRKTAQAEEMRPPAG